MCAFSKYLGINLDTKLDFKSHIANIETKISRSVGILSKLRFLFPSSTLLLLYFTLIHPHLLYGLPLWGCTFGSYLKKLQSLQNKAIRIISNTSRRSSITKQYHNLGVLKIIDLYTYEVAKLMHQRTMQKLPHCFTFFLLTFRTFLQKIPNRIPKTTSTSLSILQHAAKNQQGFKG